MRFEDVLHNGRLWAVVYDGDKQDILTKTFANWLDPAFLEDFFSKNSKDLETYFHITNLDIAIYDTIADAASLSCLILDIRPNANLDTLFRPLENQRIREMILKADYARFLAQVICNQARQGGISNHRWSHKTDTPDIRKGTHP